ncbi:MAG TPA: Hpt domain-containing protein [Dongiaceae bacterium]|nr:Hpt domain-containing protein [Dongiaceae bacterium]
MVTLVPMPANSNKPDEEAGDGTIATSLARAEKAVANLARDYATWALVDVAKARTALAAANDDLAGRGQHVEALFRIGHDLKGQGSSFGFPLVTKIGHSLCALTRNRARGYESRDLDLAKSHLDALDLILTKGIKGEGGKVGADLVAKLESRVAELLG